MPVSEDTTNKPAHGPTRHTRLKRELIHQQDRLGLRGTGCNIPLVAPQLHGAHWRLLDEANTGSEFHQRHVRVIDGQKTEQKDVAAEHPGARLYSDIRQRSHLFRCCHAEERPHLRRNALDGSDPFPDALG